MTSRRVFLKVGGVTAVLGTLAARKPPKKPPPTTTTTATTTSTSTTLVVGGGIYADLYADVY